MIDEMGYIGISPANDRTTSEKIQWLNECMKYVSYKDGTAKIKFHGFAVTSLPLISKYPWYSVDSTSWVTFGKYGQILYPRTVKGVFDYSKPPYVISISNKSPNIDKKGKHFFSLSGIEQEYLLDYLSNIGIPFEKAQSNCIYRDRVNMAFYINVEKFLKDKNDVKIYFAGNFPMLTKIGREFKTRQMALSLTDSYNRLCSFYYKKYAIKTFKLKKDINEKKRITRRINSSSSRNRK
jgi:hypothetical protein